MGCHLHKVDILTCPTYHYIQESGSLCLCPENFSEVEFKDIGLICLAEGILRQESIYSVA